jgi:hypothetical protein
MTTLGQRHGCYGKEEQKDKGKAYLADKVVSDVFCCYRESCALWPKLVSWRWSKKRGKGG